MSIIWVEIPVRNGLQQKKWTLPLLHLPTHHPNKTRQKKTNKETIWLNLYFIPPESRRFLEDSTIKKSNSASKRIYVDMTITSSSCSTLQRLSAASNCLPAEAETSYSYLGSIPPTQDTSHHQNDITFLGSGIHCRWVGGRSKSYA